MRRLKHNISRPIFSFWQNVSLWCCFCFKLWLQFFWKSLEFHQIEIPVSYDKWFSTRLQDQTCSTSPKYNTICLRDIISAKYLLQLVVFTCFATGKCDKKKKKEITRFPDSQNTIFSRVALTFLFLFFFGTFPWWISRSNDHTLVVWCFQCAFFYSCLKPTFHRTVKCLKPRTAESSSVLTEIQPDMQRHTSCSVSSPSPSHRPTHHPTRRGLKSLNWQKFCGIFRQNLFFFFFLHSMETSRTFDLCISGFLPI